MGASEAMIISFASIFLFPFRLLLYYILRN
jgi:hypothetical protein